MISKNNYIGKHVGKHKCPLPIGIVMASKTITIREEVYLELKQIKGEGESFSDLLHRLVLNSNGRKLERLFGAWDIDDEEWQSIEKELGRPGRASHKPRAIFE